MSTPSARPTLRAVAKEVGLSLGATSMALRNHPRISAATKKKVQAAARRLGYHPDVKLAELMQHLRMRSDVQYRETLAYVSSYASHQSWNWMSHYDYYLGAAAQALSLGYRLDLFHLGAPGMTPARMSRLLSTRAIRGLLIGGFDEPKNSLPLDWERFASVAFDYSLLAPALHRVTTNSFLEMVSVIRRLEEEGCTRIGLNARSWDDAKSLGMWHSAYLLYQEKLPRKRQIPIFFQSDRETALHDWLIRHEPDAIISAGVCDFPQDYENTQQRPPPGGIRYATMNIAYADSRSRGIDKLTGQVGRLACEHIIAQLQRNESGLPEHPQTVALVGEWVEVFATWKRKKEKWRQTTLRKLSDQSALAAGE